jgi:hypothetical protein
MVKYQNALELSAVHGTRHNILIWQHKIQGKCKTFFIMDVHMVIDLKIVLEFLELIYIRFINGL